MNWDEWIIKDPAASMVVYWFTTGKKPGVSAYICRALYFHKTELLNNIHHTNPLFEKLNALQP